MAKQRRPTAASRTGRQARGSRPAGAAALLLLAAVGVGGYLLFQHTASPQRPHPSRSSVPPTDTAPQPPPTTRPSVTAPQPAAPSPSASQTAPTQHLPQPPFGESEDVFETGARIYVAHCAGCHGRPGQPAPAAAGAAQLWEPRSRVTAELPGTLYLQIAGGVSAANATPAMPGYRHILTDTQIWDLALLLRNAGGELPDPVLHILHSGGRH